MAGLPTMSPVRALAIVAVAGLLASSVALAGGGDPQKRIEPADQARARAMLLRKTDLPGFRAERNTSGGDIDFACAALGESDLTLTGLADSPEFSAGPAFASSEAQVYESIADGSAAWTRDTSTAGIACLKSTLRREFAKEGLTLLSFRKLAFPPVSQRSAAYRIALSGKSQGISVRVFFDAVVLLHSRAEVFLAVGSALVPPVKSVDVGLARTLASRMKTAMRGA
jgi:hypothetical protein